MGHVKLIYLAQRQNSGRGHRRTGSGGVDQSLYARPYQRGMYASDLASIMVPYPTFADAAQGAAAAQTRRTQRGMAASAVFFAG